jgi:hypothetical protein
VIPVAIRLRHNDVFINCPFDRTYQPIFDAIIFAVRDLGFQARCALEVDDSALVRTEKIQSIIEQCRYGIHDISAVTLDPDTGLPRFNMPFALGLYVGCWRFGNKVQRTKSCLILDDERFRYQKFISDIAGQDIHAHGGAPEGAIAEARNWLVTASRRKRLPGGMKVIQRYRKFRDDLPALCASLHREPSRLTFVDLSEMVGIWMQANP